MPKQSEEQSKPKDTLQPSWSRYPRISNCFSLDTIHTAFTVVYFECLDTLQYGSPFFVNNLTPGTSTYGFGQGCMSVVPL